MAFGPAALAATQSAAVERIAGVAVSDDATLAASAPRVSMPSGLLCTAEGRVLWERNADDARAMASLTKVMTAVVVLDEASPDDMAVVSERAARVGEAEVDLVAGQRVRVRDLLEAMLVRSANDAAFALAEHVAGTSEAFVALMNAKARELGLRTTSFANPHGLDAPGHRSSARDLAVLTLYAMKDPTFASIVREPSVTVRSPSGITKRYENSNRLLGSYEGATGVKTGWTNRAGYCVIASAERGGVGLVAVVLGAKSERDRFAQARTLLDWGFEHYSVQTLASADETAALVPVREYLDVTVPAVVAETTAAPVFDLAGEVVRRVEVASDIAAPVAAGERLGTLRVEQAGRTIAEVPIVAAHDVRDPDVLRSIGIWFTRQWRRVFGGPLVAAPAVLI
jgi:D-alanyl-D-alanine carboxypeptidase